MTPNYQRRIPRDNREVSEMKTWSSHLLDNLSNCLICTSKVFMGIPTHDLNNACAVLLPTELWSHTVARRSIFWPHVFHERNDEWKKCLLKCGVENGMKSWEQVNLLGWCMLASNCNDHLLILFLTPHFKKPFHHSSFLLRKTWAQQVDVLSTVWLHSSVGKSTTPA